MFVCLLGFDGKLYNFFRAIWKEWLKNKRSDSGGIFRVNIYKSEVTILSRMYSRSGVFSDQPQYLMVKSYTGLRVYLVLFMLRSPLNYPKHYIFFSILYNLSVTCDFDDFFFFWKHSPPLFYITKMQSLKLCSQNIYNFIQ